MFRGRHQLAVLAIGGFALARFGHAAEPGVENTRPNIIFILVDDLGYGDVGVFFQNARRLAGNRASHQTPNLDRLATDGAMLTNHYCAAPVCAPSRTSLLLGVHQGHANVRNNQFDKALADNHTLATVLRQAGYATAAIGKWGLHGRVQGATPNWPAHPLNRGFDSFFGYIRHVDGHEHYPKEAPYRNRGNTPPKKFSPTNEEADDANPALHGKEVWDDRREISLTLDKCYTADLFTARAKDWIVRHHAAHPQQPFFTYLAYDTPHAVLELPTSAYPAGGGLKGGLQWLGQPGRMINTAEGKIDSWIHPDYARATYDDDHDPATPDRPWPNVYQRYATSIRRIDDAVGDLIQLLRDLKLDENTLIVFTSDNGPEIESYLPGQPITPEFFASYGPFDGVKRDLWEGGWRVPTLARWPAQIPAGRIIAQPSAHWDWLPTLAMVAGLPPPAVTDGASLLPDLTGRGVSRAARAIYTEYQGPGSTPNYSSFEPIHRNRLRGQMQALRLGDFIGVRYDVKSAADDFELYEVRSDPKQIRNLATDPACADLQATMKATVLQSRRPDPAAPRPYDAAAVPAVKAATTADGLTWDRFEGAFAWVPAMNSLPTAIHGVSATPDLRAVSPSDHAFAAAFAGYLVVPTEGDYTFMLAADTGAFFRLHEAAIIDCDFGYQGGRERTATVKLTAGLHPVSLLCRHAGSAQPLLFLDWSGPGFTRQPIPPSAFRH